MKFCNACLTGWIGTLGVFTGSMVVALGASSALGLDQAQLTANRALWNSHNISDYNIDLEQLCYCAGSGLSKLKVRNDVITEVIPGPPSHPDNPSFYNTIDSLFDRLQTALDSPTPYFQLEAQFDPIWGFPSNAFLHTNEFLADSDVRYQVGNFTPVPEPTAALLCVAVAIAAPLCRYRKQRLPRKC